MVAGDLQKAERRTADKRPICLLWTCMSGFERRLPVLVQCSRPAPRLDVMRFPGIEIGRKSDRSRWH